MPGDIILKEGGKSNSFFFIHQGMCEVLIETEDFLYFDFEKVKQFIAHEKNFDEDMNSEVMSSE